MDRSESVRHRAEVGDNVHLSGGDRPDEAPSRGESPSAQWLLCEARGYEVSIWVFLSDHQRMSLAFFEVAHGSCGSMNLIPYLLDDLETVDLLYVECAVCEVSCCFGRNPSGEEVKS